MGTKVKEVAIKTIALVLAIVFLLPGHILANTEQQKADRETKDIERITKYITIDKNNKAVFYREKAVKDGVSKSALEIGDSFMKYYGDIVDAENGSSTKKKKKWPIYGRYCGPGHSGPGKPIDRLDAACARHDDCYHRKGYHRCSCDKKLKKELRKITPKLRGKARRIARAMRVWIAIKTFFKTQKGGWFACRK